MCTAVGDTGQKVVRDRPSVYVSSIKECRLTGEVRRLGQKHQVVVAKLMRIGLT